MPALLDKRHWIKQKDEHYAASGEDAWLLKGSGGGFTGAIRIMKPKPEVVAAWQAEIAACAGCKEGGPVKHGTTSIWADGSLYTYQCRSFSRAVNPTTGEITGSVHCTCDGCF